MKVAEADEGIGMTGDNTFGAAASTFTVEAPSAGRVRELIYCTAKATFLLRPSFPEGMVVDRTTPNDIENGFSTSTPLPGDRRINSWASNSGAIEGDISVCEGD